jgi:NitT/TauT family transport system substrate-binding protein
MYAHFFFWIRSGACTILLCVLFPLFAFPLSEEAETSVAETSMRQIRIATVPWIGWAPIDVAQAKGFLRAHGLNGKVIRYDDPILILEALRADKADLGFEMVGSIVGRWQRGDDVVILAEVDWSHGGDKIIVRPGRSLAELRGQHLGVFLKLPSCLNFLEKYLLTQNLKLTDFQVVELPSDKLTEHFIVGRVPIIVNFEPHAGRAIKQAGGEVLATSADFNGVLPEAIFSTSKRLKQISPKDVSAVLRAWADAVDWLNKPANWEEFREILLNRTFSNEPPLTDQKLQEMLGEVRFHSRDQLVERNLKSEGLSAYLAEMRDFLARNQMLKRDFSGDNLFKREYVHQALSKAAPRNKTEQ